MDYIFNYKNSLTTNQMGFDTIEINLVMYINGFVQTESWPEYQEGRKMQASQH